MRRPREVYGVDVDTLQLMVDRIGPTVDEVHGNAPVGPVPEAASAASIRQICTGTWAGPRTVVVCTISTRSSSTDHPG